MSYDLEEQEQLDNIKAWWNNYGKIVTNIVTIILLGVTIFFAYKWYFNYQESKAYNLVVQINTAIEAKKNDDVFNLAQKLYKQYPNSTHTAIGILRASQDLAQTDINKSISLLKLAANNKQQQSYAVLASYRLAGMLIDNKKHDEAINILSSPVSNAWQALFYDRLGDIYADKGNAAQAKEFYSKALKLAKENNNNALESFVELKMNINNSNL